MEREATALLGSTTLPPVLALLTGVERPLTASEITRRLMANRESVQRALARLERAAQPGLEPKVGIEPTTYALPRSATWVEFR
jgi:hypothetical protein